MPNINQLKIRNYIVLRMLLPTIILEDRKKKCLILIRPCSPEQDFLKIDWKSFSIVVMDESCYTHTACQYSYVTCLKVFLMLILFCFIGFLVSLYGFCF